MAISSAWTFQENKVFEEAFAKFPEIFSRGEWHEIAKLIPTKTSDQIKLHYNHLLEDSWNIECGLVPLPDYKDTDIDESESGHLSECRNLKEDKEIIVHGNLQPSSSLLRPPQYEAVEEGLREMGYEIVDSRCFDCNDGKENCSEIEFKYGLQGVDQEGEDSSSTVCQKI